MELMNRSIQILPWAWRHQRRVKKWRGLYKSYLNNKRAVPYPAVLQLIPTEYCNLRCAMCNQWGDNGYFLQGPKKYSHADINKLIGFLEQYKSRQKDFLLSIHGGEPLIYKNIDSLVDWVADNSVDTMITTNGTLFEKHLDSLSRANKNIVYLLSIDGDESTHDNIRGKGNFNKIIQGVNQLNQYCIDKKTGRLKIIINFCLSEFNYQCIEEIYNIAKDISCVALNYNFRWFMPKSAGQEYDRFLHEQWNLPSSGAWKGWVATEPMDVISEKINTLYKFQKKHKWHLPFITFLPRGLTESQSRQYFLDYKQLFGIKSCIMPSYQIRIHSKGEAIFCPGHPDVSLGNVFEQDFDDVYLGKNANRLRKHVEKELLPICNRCCGLYMTYTATQKLGKGFYPN